VPQLVAEQLPQPEDDADDFTVSPPPAPLLTKPHEDISLWIFFVLHDGQNGLSFPITRYSKSRLH